MKAFWLILFVANLVGAYYFAIKGNMGLELIDLFSVYICWKEIKEND